ncbi:lysine N(6)-hydroxylase/L-ornithine N(5)-oxygenase family protein [Exiguobacterium sp. TNDT2]|uniref:lysine N(6)-hydroxylase/L-ornithine N(5)-oxygenase family protein n=1 Tax=Exiguobacterium sp. TNDT2 TaxID=2233531 RepID=UPI00130082A4|nr:SidA/IucD/PvdA family monooxygenase [Exiguobacterium sp. TNDT2]
MDFIAIGCGPYNLGLMALSEATSLKGVCFEEREDFKWHEGMLLESATMQTHYLYDLVTLADPTNRHSYLNYLKQAGRLQTFIAQESPTIPRTEFNLYLQSVAVSLDTIKFSHRVVDVRPAADGFLVTVEAPAGETVLSARHVVVGTGAEPLVPDAFQDVIHTSSYRMERERLLETDRIVVIGSGQSAAEVYLDLLSRSDKMRQQIDWVTRSDVFESLESGKLGEEIFSLSYVEYFNRLPYAERERLGKSFERFRNGVNPETLRAIYGFLYHRTADGSDQATNLYTQIEIERVSHESSYLVEGTHQHTGESFTNEYDAVVAATGYRPCIPAWVKRFDIEWEAKDQWRVNNRYQIATETRLTGSLFTHTNLEHSHGPAATNLGMAVYRNAIMLNEMVGKTVFEVAAQRPFTSF